MSGKLQRWRPSRAPRRRMDAMVTEAGTDQPFALEAVHDGAITRWMVSGEIDIATRPRLAPILESVPDGDGPLIVDLTGVTFMDSTALAVLLKVDAAARIAGRKLAIVCPEGPARLLFAVTGVEAELPLHPTVADAVAALD